MTYNVKPHSVVASNWKTLPLTLDQIGYATLECLFHTCSWQMDCVQQHFKSFFLGSIVIVLMFSAPEAPFFQGLLILLVGI